MESTDLKQILNGICDTKEDFSNLTKAEKEFKFTEMKANSFNKETGNLHEIDGYSCETCNNKGIIARIVCDSFNNKYELAFNQCHCIEIRNTLKRFGKSGLKDIFKNFNFEKYEVKERWQKTIKEKAIDFVNSDKGWFFIGGQSGAGKTFICTAIAGSLIKKGKGVRYMLWRDDVVKLKGAINDCIQYEELITPFKNVDVLYIDDLFKTGKDNNGKVQKPTPADVNIAFELLNYRSLNYNLKTIISSECTLYNIIDIDEALAGRIAEQSFKNGFGVNIKPDINKNYRLREICDL